MGPREVVKAAFEHRKTEAVPYWIPMDEDVSRQVDSYYGGPEWRSKLIPYLSAGHLALQPQDRGDGVAIDVFGSLLEQGNVLHVVRPVLTSPTLAGYRWPDAQTMVDWDQPARYLESSASESFRIYGLAFGVFERAWLMRGFEDLMIDMVEHPVFVHELLDGIAEIHVKAMDLIIDRLPVDAYFGGDDWCDQRGPMMGIELWRKFFRPRLKKLVSHCHERGLSYVLHSCGNVFPLVEDLMAIEIDALESCQAEAMNVYALKDKVGNRMVLIGGLGVQSTLPFSSPSEVRAEAIRLAQNLGRGGGYVLAPSKPLMTGVPPENVAALVEAAVEVGGHR